MRQTSRPKKAILLSLFLHGLLLIFLICSLEFSTPPIVISNNDSKIVHAVALKDSPLLAPPTKLAEQKPVIKPTIPIPQPTPPPSAPPMSIPKSQAANTASPPPPTEKKLAIPDVHKKQLAEKPQKETIKKDLTKQLLADLEDEISKQKKTKQKSAKNKFNQELKTQSAKALQQLVKEQKAAASGMRAQHMQGIIDKYKALILQAIGQQWVVPSHVNKRLFCELLIRLAPGGFVLEVQITKSSGDILLDRSARAAVFKASPLPVPGDIYSFEPFRHFVLKVKPENVLENKGDQGFWIG